MDCQSGSTIKPINREAASRNDVVAALGNAALQLRRELGEPASSVDKYNSPLDRATSSSPDALELLTLGYRRHLTGNLLEAIPYYERAVQTDPNLALAHAALGAAYSTVGDAKQAAVAARTAFSLRDRMTAPARFNAESSYHFEVNGDSEASCAVLAQWVDAFPHDVIARINLSSCLLNVGQLDRSLGEAREAARLLPAAFTYVMWIGRAMQTDRLDEAQKALDEARGRGFDSPLLRDTQVQVAFLRNVGPPCTNNGHRRRVKRASADRGKAGQGVARPIPCRSRLSRPPPRWPPAFLRRAATVSRWRWRAIVGCHRRSAPPCGE